jgi:uncharacterized membrane protein
VGTLLVPKWKSAIFWPLLISPIFGNFEKIVAELIEYESPSRFLVKGDMHCFTWKQYYGKFRNKYINTFIMKNVQKSGQVR